MQGKEINTLEPITVNILLFYYNIIFYLKSNCEVDYSFNSCVKKVFPVLHLHVSNGKSTP